MTKRDDFLAEGELHYENDLRQKNTLVFVPRALDYTQVLSCILSFSIVEARSDALSSR